MKKYQFITFLLVALTVVAAFPAEANERNFKNQREEKGMRFTETQKKVLTKRFSNIFLRIEQSLNRLENISERIDSRIEKIENETNKDLSDAKNKLSEAQNKISETKILAQNKKEELKKETLKDLSIEIKSIRDLLTETVILIK